MTLMCGTTWRDCAASVWWCVSLLVLALSAAPVLSAQPAALVQDAGWPQAIERLAREKILAEGCASILKAFADGAPMARVQGERLYARAKADMDGLIGVVVAELANGRPLAEVLELRPRLEAVVAQRRRLCRHADAVVGTSFRQRSGRADAADLLAEGSGDAPSSLIEATAQIWRAYGAADQVRRAAMVAEIDATRWLPYGQVPAS